MHSKAYSEALYRAVCATRVYKRDAGIEAVADGYKVHLMPGPASWEAHHDRMELVRQGDPLPANYSPPWVNEFLIEAGREACFRHRGRGVAGGVYEPFLSHPDWERAGFTFIACSGTVASHTDYHGLPRYGHFVVVVNDGYVARQTGDMTAAAQPEGTIFTLDIHDDHELVHDNRVDAADIDETMLGYCVLSILRPHKMCEWETRLHMIAAWQKVEHLFFDSVPQFTRQP